MIVGLVANATCCAPHAKATAGCRICDRGSRQLDYDRHVVEAADIVHGGIASGSGPKREGPLGDRGQRSSFRSAIGQDAEERFEIDEEWIVPRTREQLDVAGLDHGVGVTLDLFSTDECVHGADAIRRYRTTECDFLLPCLPGERDLEHEIFSCIAGVVDLDLVQLLVLRSKREAWRVRGGDWRACAKHEHGVRRIARRREGIDVIYVVPR
jgi:hypothetical protein